MDKKTWARSLCQYRMYGHRLVSMYPYASKAFSLGSQNLELLKSIKLTNFIEEKIYLFIKENAAINTIINIKLILS